jgi:hypothetical protein
MKFESQENKCPELNFSDGGQSNWREVERWLKLNSAVFHRAKQMQYHLRLFEIDGLRIAVEMLSRQNKELFDLKIKQAQNSTFSPVLTISVPRVPFFKKWYARIIKGIWID